MILRLTGIKKARNRLGAVYYYDRVTGKRITSPYGTQAFYDEVMALRRVHVEAPAADKKLSGTWGWLATYYKSTSKFTDRGALTKRDYLGVLDYMAPLDAMPLARMTPEWIAEFVELTYRKRKRRFANYVLQVISRVWNIGFAAGKCPHPNPVSKEHKIRRPKGTPTRNRPWSLEEAETVFAAATGPLRIAMALALWAGWREGDVCGLPRSAYDGVAIQGRQGKTGDLVWVPAHSALRALLDAELAELPRLATAPLVINRRGGPYSENGLKASFFGLIRRLVKAGQVAPGLSFHGLRTTLATRIADAGGDTRDIAAALGHATEAMASHYARAADRRRRAAHAIGLLEQHPNGNLETRED